MIRRMVEGQLSRKYKLCCSFLQTLRQFASRQHNGLNQCQWASPPPRWVNRRKYLARNHQRWYPHFCLFNDLCEEIFLHLKYSVEIFAEMIERLFHKGHSDLATFWQMCPLQVPQLTGYIVDQNRWGVPAFRFSQARHLNSNRLSISRRRLCC